jgi:tetratricopeptide (TPR) repeat protein
MNKENKPKNSSSGYLLIIGVFFGVLLISVFLLYTNTYERRCLYTAKKLLKAYKTSQATALLENVKLQIKKKNPQLNFLLFYAYVQADKFNKAQNLLHNLDKINLHDMVYFQKIINRLNLHGEDHMIYELLKKAQELNLTEDFFISISVQKKSIVDESSVLELGMKYLKHNETAVKKLKKHLIQRLVEVEAYLEEDNKDFTRTLKYLEKARQLSIQIQDKSFEADIHYRLGIAYKQIKDFEKAKKHLTLSAKLGNKNAEKLLS